MWSGGEIIAEDVQGDDLADVVNLHAGAAAWWVLPRQGDRPSALLHQAARALDLDELAIGDLIAEDRRVKFEELSQARLVTTNAVTLDHQTVELTVRPLAMIVTDRAFICLVDAMPTATGTDSGVDPARLLVGATEQLAHSGVEGAMQVVVGAVISGYDAVVEWLEDATDELADSLFEQRPLSKDEQLRAFKLRAALTQLRRLTEPMREVLAELADSQPDDSPAARQWTLLGEHHQRVANAANALGEALVSILDTSLALAGARTNEVMRSLTGWAAIIAVPTLITGFAGQNVAFPLTGSWLGFWCYLALMVLSCVLLFVWFRRKGWV